MSIKKPGNFDLSGRTPNLCLVPQMTNETLRQCAQHPQYCIDEMDVRTAKRSTERAMRDNAERNVYVEPA